MSNRYIPNFRGANDYLEGGHPESFTEKRASELGQGADLNHISFDLDENPNFEEKKEFLPINKGDYVELKEGLKSKLGDLKARGLPNLFIVTNVLHLNDGKRTLAIKNEKDPRYRLRDEENNFRLVTK